MKALSRARFAVFLLILAAFLAFPAPYAHAERIADLPQPADYVSDFAHVLSPEAVARLDSICSQLEHSAANARIAVVTVHDLDGDDAADYATQLEDHWKMGDKSHQDQNRYAMVLLAVADHKYRLEIGYGLEGILPDGKTGDIGRSMVPDLRAGDYDGAVTDAVGQIAQVIADDAHVTLEESPNMGLAPVESHRHQQSSGRAILGIIITVWILFHLLRGFGGYGLLGAWGLGLLSGGSRGRDSFWGSGGGGGGDGFSGFGGGGGGFGGGGAGGSW